jgi:hypothetical protein
MNPCVHVPGVTSGLTTASPCSSGSLNGWTPTPTWPYSGGWLTVARIGLRPATARLSLVRLTESGAIAHDRHRLVYRAAR